MIKSCTCICKGRQDEVRHSLKADSEKHTEMPRTGFEPVTTCTNVHHIHTVHVHKIHTQFFFIHVHVCTEKTMYMSKLFACTPKQVFTVHMTTEPSAFKFSASVQGQQKLITIGQARVWVV